MKMDGSQMTKVSEAVRDEFDRKKVTAVCI